MGLTAGRTQSCLTPQSGGVVRFAVGNRLDVDAVTIGSANKDFTAITMDTDKVFYVFDCKEETVEFTEDGELTNDSGVFTSRITGTWTGWSQSDRSRLVELYSTSRCGLVVIAELENGSVILIGINPEKPTVTNKYVVKMEKSTYKSGKALTDANSNEISLICRSTSPASVFTPGWSGVPLD